MNPQDIKTLAQMEKEAIVSTVSLFGVRKTMRLLGISKTSLYRKLTLYKIPRVGRGKSATIVQPTETPKLPVLLVMPRDNLEQSEASLRCPQCHALLLLPDQEIK